jgi:uncharacterized protein (DUF58 family)
MVVTRFAKYYLLLVAVIIMAAANTKTNLLNLFTAFLLALLLLSWAFLRSNLAKVVVRLESPPEVFSDTTCPLRYLFANHGIYHKFGLCVRDPVSDYQYSIPDIPPQATLAVTHDKKFTRRGIVIWQSITVKSDFPFGFFCGELKAAVNHTLLVLPRPLPFSLIPLPNKPSMFREGGFFSSLTRTASQDFAGMREYQPGDSQKRIHWKASAKAQQLIVKEYEEDLPAGVSIVMDIFPETDGAKQAALFEQAIVVTASVVWQVAHLGYLILFAQGSHMVSYGRGSEHALHILRLLAQADADKDSSDRTVVEKAWRDIPRSTTAIFVFLRMRPEIAAYLQELVRCACQVVAISVAADDSYPPLPGVEAYRLRAVESELLVLERVN